MGVTRAKCTGCKACIAACPYGARYVHPDGFVDKCTFCLHRVSAGKAPACVETCPTRALTFGDLADPGSAVAALTRSRRFTVLQPGSGNAPNVFPLVGAAHAAEPRQVLESLPRRRGARARASRRSS